MKRKPIRSAAPVVSVNKPEPTALEQIAYARRRIEFYLEHELERCRETKAAFLAAPKGLDPADVDLSYFIKRSAEDVFLAGAKEREVLGLTAFYRKTIDAQGGGVAVVLEQIEKDQVREVQRLMDSPYRHNSTCAMSNFHQECELRAKAEFWKPMSSFGRGTVATILHDLREWLAAEKEMLDAYALR